MHRLHRAARSVLIMIALVPAYVTLAVVLLAVGLLLCGGLILAMARVLLRPPRMTDGKALYLLDRLTPADLGLAFERYTFDVQDDVTGGRIKIASWWLPCAAARRTVVVLHGYGDAKVGGIAWAPCLLSCGWNVLAIDLRAHGESQGDASTAGWWERHDVEQVINQLKQAKPQAAESVALFGVSLGAAVALATAELAGDGVVAVICESPFTDYATAARLHGKRMGMPLEIFQPLALPVAAWMSQSDFNGVAPIELVLRVTCPLLIFHAGDDPLVSPAAVKQFADVLSRRVGVTEHVIVEHAVHTKTILADPKAYRATVCRFLRAAARESDTDAR